MPQAKQIILTDDQQNSVLFDPNNIDRNGTAHFLADGTGQLNLADHLSLQVVRPNSNVTGKAILRFETVKSQTVDGLSVPAGKAITELTTKYPPNWSSADRARHQALLKSAFSNADVVAVLENLQSIY